MQLHLPSGQAITPPRDPTTYVEQATGTDGDPVRMKILELDVSAAVAFHRQRPLIQGINVAGSTLTTSTWTPMPLAEIADAAQGHNDSTNTSRWYAPLTSNTTDWYLCSGYVALNSTDTAHVHIAGLRVDGGTPYEGMKIPAGAHTVTPAVVDLIQMTSDGTHYLEVAGWQNTGAGVATIATGKAPSLTARWVCSGSGTVVALPSNPRTWSGADALTADSAGAGEVPLNVHLRDVLRFLNYPPIARLTSQGSSQTIASGTTWVSLQLPTPTVDNNTGWSSGTNTLYTFQRPGLYTVSGQANITDANPASGYRMTRLLHTLAAGGTAVYGGNTSVPATATATGTHLLGVHHIRAAVGDTLEVQMQHNQGSALTVKNSVNDASRLIVAWRAR